MEKAYEIKPRDLDGWWRLRLIDVDGEEAGGGVFEPDDYDAALDEGEAWIST